MKRTLFPALLATLALLLPGARAQAPTDLQQAFENAEQWARSLDNPERDNWQKPDEVIRALALPPAAVVADVGAGTGYFATRLARAVPRGRVLGIDISPDMVRYLNERARREGLSNLSARLGAPDDPGLPPRTDLVLLVNTYHHIGSRESYFRRVRQMLGPNGRLAIIDFRPNAPYGPPRHARVPPAQVISELAQSGFELAQQHDFLPHQFFIVLRPRRR